MAIKFLDDTAQAPDVAPPQGTIKFVDAPAVQAEPAPAPEVDEFEAVQQTDFDRIKNVYFTDGELQAMKDKGKIGFLEASKFVDPVKMLPGANMATEIYETGNLANIASKLNKGEELSVGEQADIDNHFKQIIEQQVRGFSWGGSMMNYGATMPASMLEFAASFGIGRAATKGVTVAATKAAEKVAGKALQKAAIKTAEKTALVGATMAAAPQIYIPRYNERSIANNVAITDKGELLLRDSDESPAVTALKAFGDTAVEVSSEMSGAALGKYIVSPLGKFISKPVKSAFERLPVNVRDKLFDAYRAIQPDAKIKDMFTKAGFHGAIEEMGEERVADVLSTSLDLDGEQGYTAEQYMDALYPGKDQLLLEAGLFSATGGSMRGASYLKNMLMQKGSTAEEANDTVNNLSALEIDKAFEDLTVPETKESLLRVKERAYQLAKSAGVKDEEAQASSKIMMGQALWGSKQYNITPEAYFDNLKLDIRNETPKARTNKELKRMLNEEPDVSGIFPKFYKEAVSYLKGAKLTTKQRGQSLSTFIKSRGGIYDVGGDLKSRDLGSDIIRLTPTQRAERGLPVTQSRGQVNNLENLKQEAFDAGYFPDAATYEDVTDDMFKEAIERDYNGKKIYPGVQDVSDAVGLFQQYDEIGLTPDMSIEQVASLIQQYFIEKEMPLEDVPEQPGDLYQSAPKTNTEAFKKWFGDSKVVDADGKPLVVYHGTTASIDAFDPGKIGSKFGYDTKGFFFTDLERSARSYSMTDEEAGDRAFRMSAEGRAKADARTVKAYVSIQNPLTLNDVAADPRYEKKPYMDPIDFYDDNRAIISDLLDTGKYDGVIFKLGGERLIAPLKPEQIKSVDNRGTFDANDPRILYQSVERGGFRSTLLDAATSLKQGKGSGEQMLGILKNTAGVKEEEIAWTGLDEFLKGKKSVTKQEIVDYLNENQVRVEEVTLGNEKIDTFYIDDDGLLRGPYPTREQALSQAENRGWEPNVFIKEHGLDNTKFSQYTLPGGENYREVLLTLPQKDVDKWRVVDRNNKVISKAMDYKEAESLAKQTSGSALEPIVEQTDSFKSSHFDQPNILAHVRLNDRMDADGKRVLFVEEIQSDWHQAGRKKGYKDGNVKVTDEAMEAGRLKAVKALKGQDNLGYSNSGGALSAIANHADWQTRWEWIGDDVGKQDVIDYVEMGRGYIDQKAKVPDAPLKKTWHEMAFRRIAQMAAEGGYDRVAWTTGEQQNDRFDLSKSLDNITLRDKGDGVWKITGYKDEKKVVQHDDVKTEDLPDYIGKDAADKLMAKENDAFNERELTGLDLKVGGEGMKGFYDKIIHAYAAKFGKKFGAKVSDTTIENTSQQVSDKEVADLDIELGSDDKTAASSFKVHSIDVTPEMRDSVLQGVTLFQGNRGSISFEDGGKQVIRLFEMADSSTLFHELGHMFLRELRTAAEISPEAKKQFETVMKHLGSQDGNFTREQEEQFARNFEQYLMEGSAPSKILRDTFESLKEMMIQVYQTVMSLGGTLNNETRAVMDQLIGGKDLDIYMPEIKIDNTESIWGKFYRDWVDDLAPIESITKAFEAMRGKLPDGTNPNFLARLFAATKGRIVENIQNQTFYVDQDGNSVITGEGFKPILEDFDVEFSAIEPDYEQRTKDFKDYLIARRYIEDLKDREDVEVSAKQEEESAAIMAKLSFKYGSEFVRFNSYATRVYEFEKRILFNLVRSGIMSQENFDKITSANKNYVPFQRIFEEEEISDGFVITGKGKFEGKSALSIVKKITGSDREVNDIFENIVRSTARTIQAAYKNNVAASICRMADAMPENITKVKAPMKPIELEDGKTVFRPSGKPFGNVIEFYVDGKRQFVEVSKPLYEAMQGMHPGEITIIGKFFRGIASFFRAAATLPPDFWIRNFIRDVNQASVQSEAGIKPVDIIQGITAVMGKTELYHEWMRSGGSFNSYMNLDENGMQEAMNELLRPQGKAMLYAKSLGLEALKDASGAIEAATRIAMFRRSKLAGGSSMRAALESRDGTLDFSRSGRVGKIANRYIPFLNAGIQGGDKLIRAFRKNPEVMTFRALATITLPSIILTGYYLYGAPDDEREEFLEIPQWQKDMFWVVKVGDSWRRIPKPFSLGYAFGSLPERFLLWSYDGKKPEAEGMWREFVLGLGGSLSPIQDVGTLMTPVGRIVVESASNYNFFSGRSIYPTWMDRLPAEERVTKSTSQIAKKIGENLGVSPALVDNAIRGMLATTTPYVIGASDDIINAVKEWNGETVPSEVKRSADMMFVRGFSVRDPSGYQAVSTQNFFEKHKEIEELHNSYTAKKGKAKQEFYEKHGDAIRKYKPFHNFKERIGDLGDRLDMIYDDPKMSSEAKVKQIKVIEDQILDVAKRANSWFNANKGKDE